MAVASGTNCLDQGPLRVLLGKQLSTIEKHPYSWAFHFDNAILDALSLWRLLARGTILVTSADDGHLFGLPSPVDAKSLIQQEVGAHSVVTVESGLAPSDLRVHFENEVVLEILNLSAGYECWTLNGPDGLMVIGRNI